MSEYIEDRINKLESRMSASKISADNMERRYNFLNARVNDFEDKIKDLQLAVEKLFKLDNSTNYTLRNILEDITKIKDNQNDHTDQSAEEFTKVVRCEKCIYSKKSVMFAEDLTDTCGNPNGMVRAYEGGFCSEGEEVKEDNQ